MVNLNAGAKMMTASGVIALLWFGSGTAVAHEGEDSHSAKATEPAALNKAAPIDVKLFDLELVDQDGHSAKFRSDVIGERIVVVNFIYTTCTTVCPVTSAIFGQVQWRLGERLGKDVFLVSLSVDPVTDRPARLKAYAKKHKARSGWIWLTGNKLIVDKVLDGLGAYTPNYEDHPAMVLVGDGRTGQWARFFGFASPAQIMAKVDGLVAAREHTVAATAPQ